MKTFHISTIAQGIPSFHPALLWRYLISKNNFTATTPACHASWSAGHTLLIAQPSTSLLLPPWRSLGSQYEFFLMFRHGKHVLNGFQNNFPYNPSLGNKTSRKRKLFFFLLMSNLCPIFLNVRLGRDQGSVWGEKKCFQWMLLVGSQHGLFAQCLVLFCLCVSTEQKQW